MASSSAAPTWAFAAVGLSRKSTAIQTRSSQSGGSSWFVKCDEAVLDAFIEGVRKRMAELWLGKIEPDGNTWAKQKNRAPKGARVKAGQKACQWVMLAIGAPRRKTPSARRAAALALSQVTDRRRAKSFTNVIEIVSAEWAAWLKLGVKGYWARKIYLLEMTAPMNTAKKPTDENVKNQKD